MAERRVNLTRDEYEGPLLEALPDAEHVVVLGSVLCDPGQIFIADTPSSNYRKLRKWPAGFLEAASK